MVHMYILSSYIHFSKYIMDSSTNSVVSVGPTRTLRKGRVS